MFTSNMVAMLAYQYIVVLNHKIDIGMQAQGMEMSQRNQGCLWGVNRTDGNNPTFQVSDGLDGRILLYNYDRVEVAIGIAHGNCLDGFTSGVGKTAGAYPGEWR